MRNSASPSDDHGVAMSHKKYEVAPIAPRKSLSQSTNHQHQQHQHQSQHRPHHQQQLTPKKLLHFVHRSVIVVAAVGYVGIMFSASTTTMALLRGWDNPWNGPEDDHFPLVLGFLGSQTIRESPLITDFLHNSTTPVNDSVIYLEDPQRASFTPCATFTASQAKVFQPVFMRTLFDDISRDTSYRIPQLSSSEIELIAPIVDCRATANADDFTSGKFLFLVRQRLNPDSASLLVVYLSVQQYKIRSQTENGPAAVATLQLVHDMRANDMDKHVHYIASPGYPYHKPSFRVYDLQNVTEDGLLLLRLVPPLGSRHLPHTIETACREGFFLKAESEQSNINNYQWQIEANAALAVSRWRWISKSVLHDSWAWVHAIHFFIGMGLLSNLVILCLAMYRNFRAGTPWIGDAFVAISTSQLVNGGAVLVSWYVNEFWSLREFCLTLVFHVANHNNVRVYDSHMRADLLTLYLALCGLIGSVFRERIDPLVAVVSFLIGYDLRIVILQHVSVSLRDDLTAFANALFLRNVSPQVPGQDKITPMGFWTTHELGTIPSSVYFQCLLPLYVTLAIPLGYVCARKVYRHFYPDRIHVQRTANATVVSENEQSLIAQKHTLTLFEIATGAELANRFGMVSDFEPCVFIKGTKHVSADGVYSAGFVIANQKYLLQTSDFWSIVLMKILRRRFRNIYVYDVDGSSVQQTARLVYPHTLSVQDLLNMSVSVLS